MSMTSKTVGPRRRGLYGLLAGGLLSASAATLIALPVANAQCDQTVGNSIDSYLKRHPDLHQRLQAQSEAEGGGGGGRPQRHRLPESAPRCTAAPDRPVAAVRPVAGE